MEQRHHYQEFANGYGNPSDPIDVDNRIPLGMALNGFRLVLSGGNLTLVPVTSCLLAYSDGPIHKYTTMPTLAAAGLTAGHTYLICCYDDGAGNALLEAKDAASNTYTLDTRGIPSLTGDLTRRLMGMVRAATGPAWADSLTQRFVRSYNHRLPLRLSGAFMTNRFTASASLAEILSEIRVELLAWADDLVMAKVNGDSWNDTNNQGAWTAVGFDGATPEDGIGYSAANGNVNSVYMPNGVLALKTLTEGYHYVTVLGANGGSGTAAWSGAAAATSPRTQLSVAILPRGE